MTSETRTKGTRREHKSDQTELAEGQTQDTDAKAATPASSKPPNDAHPAVAATLAVQRHTKALQLREMLAREDGASLSQMMQATGWQAHTVRATLSGLRKSGMTLERTRPDKDPIYRNVEPGAGEVVPANEKSLAQEARNPNSTVATTDHPDAASLDEINTSRESAEVTP